jgi:hypothetical protein
MGKKDKKLVIFDIDKRASVASGYIKASSEVADKFMKVLNDAMDALDADPANQSLTDADRREFKETLLDGDEDDVVVLEGKKKIHTLDDILRR